MKVVDGVRAIGARANAEACALAEAELGGLQHWEEVWWQGALEYLQKQQLQCSSNSFWNIFFSFAGASSEL
jgi:hypothetical protein